MDIIVMSYCELLAGSLLAPLVGCRRAVSSKAAMASQHYLYPITMNGPHNQLQSLFDVLTIASLLNLTAVLPKLHNHQYTQTRFSNEPHAIPYDQFFDLSRLAPYVNFVSVDELKASNGWNGTFQHVLCFGSDVCYYGWMQLALQAHIEYTGVSFDYQSKEHTWQIFDNIENETDSIKLGNCDAENLFDFYTKHIRDHRYVAMASYSAFSMVNSNPCSTRRMLFNSLLVPSQRYMAIVNDYNKRHFANHAYLATHIRPYADECMELWEKGMGYKSVRSQWCKDPWLYNNFVPTIQAVAETYGITKVFLMAHPLVMRIIKEKIIEVLPNLEIYNMDVEEFLGVVPGGTVTQLSFVEEEVCRRATVFIGTKSSSMSERIHLIRNMNKSESSTSMYFHEDLGKITNLLRHTVE